jgi:hypothetical protein
MLYIKKVIPYPRWVRLEFPEPSSFENIVLATSIDEVRLIIRDIKTIMSNSLPVDEYGYHLYDEDNIYIQPIYNNSIPPQYRVEFGDSQGETVACCQSIETHISCPDNITWETYPSKEILFVLEQWLAFLETGLLIEPPLEANTIENLNELLAFWAAQPDDDARKANKLAYYEGIKTIK